MTAEELLARIAETDCAHDLRFVHGVDRLSEIVARIKDTVEGTRDDAWKIAHIKVILNEL